MVERERREIESGASAADEARVAALLRADVEATLGPGFDASVVEAAARRRLFTIEPGVYAYDVVKDVQQYLHDTFIDTTWPSCLHHPHHPLWFSGGWWRCERSEEPIARLGALASRKTGA
jgi:hypothetical protein